MILNKYPYNFMTYIIWHNKRKNKRVKWRLESSGKQDNVLAHMTIVMITCVIHSKTPSKMKLELRFLVSHMENCHGRTQEKLILVTKMLVEFWTVLKMCLRVSILKMLDRVFYSIGIISLQLVQANLLSDI